ncbi:MAG: hypothetical protein ACFE8M_10795 [Candidatus Hermodarchaeota archaeon]
MSSEKSKFSQRSRLSLKELQDQIEVFRKKRDDLNKKTKDYINELQEIDNQIDNYLKLAKNDSKKKRDYWNSKVKQLKEKKIEYKKIFDKFIDEKKSLQKLSDQVKDGNKFVSIKQIERKISALERKIETENLDISEENTIIDKIRELAKIKQDFLAKQQNSELFKIERKIQIVKINLNKIYEQLNKWSNKSQKYHIKMNELYQLVKDLRDKKRAIEEELIENKKEADKCHEQYLKLMNERKRFPKGKQSYKQGKRSKKPYKVQTKRDEELEKIKQEKLATALEKQKAGKKLDLYEARLILEKSKG